MIDTHHTDLMRELVKLQAARAVNWPNPYAPADADLERDHMDRIELIKAELSGRPLPSPALPVRKPSNIFRRLARRILPKQTTTPNNRSI